MPNLILTLLLCFSLTAYSQTYSKYNGKKESSKTTVRTEDGKTVEKLIMIAEDFLNKKQFTEAAKYYTEALIHKIDVLAITYKRGMTYFFAAEHEKAIADFNSILPIYSKPEEVYFTRGLCKYNLQDREGACEDFALSRSLGKDIDPKLSSSMCGM